VLSHDVVEWLATSAIPLKTWVNEDAQVGAWLSGIDLHRIDIRPYNKCFLLCSTCDPDCNSNMIFVHGLRQENSHYSCYNAVKWGDICRCADIQKQISNVLIIQKTQRNTEWGVKEISILLGIAYICFAILYFCCFVILFKITLTLLLRYQANK